MATHVKNTNKHFLAMSTTHQHCEDIPTDVLVQVGESKFLLHKNILIAKSNYIRRLLLESEEPDLEMIDLSNVPGGAEIFDKLASFCYGNKLEITINNVGALHCAAEYLEMTEKCCEQNLASLTHGFLTQVALASLPGAITVLKSCEDFLPAAQQLNLVNQCVEAVSVKACDEADSPTRSPANWWAEELTNLNIISFHKTITSMKSLDPNPLTIASAIETYTNKFLPDIKSPISNNPLTTNHREIFNSIVDLLPDETQIQQIFIPINFLCRLLRLTNVNFQNIGNCKKKLEKLISVILERVTVDDLLMLRDIECVRRVVIRFVEKEKSRLVIKSHSMVKVSKVVDAYLKEIAKDRDLSISQFNGIANLVPKSVREVDDQLYSAIDIYLQAHPNIDEIEREKVCNAMNPLKLSVEARAHASQNKRLPLPIVLHTLYYDQLQVRSEQSTPISAQSMRLQVNEDVKLAQENEKLRHELLWMKMYVSDMEKSYKDGSKKKKPTFFSSMSKTLGKLNPFKQGSKDTTNVDDRTDRTKARRRRFSMS